MMSALSIVLFVICSCQVWRILYSRRLPFWAVLNADDGRVPILSLSLSLFRSHCRVVPKESQRLFREKTDIIQWITNLINSAKKDRILSYSIYNWLFYNGLRYCPHPETRCVLPVLFKNDSIIESLLIQLLPDYGTPISTVQTTCCGRGRMSCSPATSTHFPQEPTERGICWAGRAVHVCRWIETLVQS